MKLARRNSVLLVAAYLTLWTMPAEAAVLFDNSVAPQNVIELAYNDAKLPYRVAEDFALAVSGVLEQVSFIGGYHPGSRVVADSFTLIIYGDHPLHRPDPASILAQVPLGSVSRSFTGTWAMGVGLYSYSASVGGVEVAGDTPYWISIVNNTGGAPDAWVWAGTRSGIAAISGDSGATWYQVGPEQLSFVLEGTVVPEPAAGWLLTTCGLAALVRSRALH